MAGRELRIAGIAAGLVLAGCGQSEESANRAAANVSATSDAPADVHVPAPARSDGLSAGFMVGRWSAINEDCSTSLEFRADGTVATPIGDARWSLEGDRLKFDYGDGAAPTVSRVRVLGPNRIEMTHASGTREVERRC